MTPHLHLGTRNTLTALDVPVVLPLDDRRRHVLVSGRPGTGKSTLLANFFADDANNGRGALLIDPHGELAEFALDLVPPRRIRKTVYIDPTDPSATIAFNVLEGVEPDQRAARAAEIVAAFQSVWSDSWGPRLEHILYNTVAALLEVPRATLLAIPRLLLSAKYRTRMLSHVPDYPPTSDARHKSLISFCCDSTTGEGRWHAIRSSFRTA